MDISLRDHWGPFCTRGNVGGLFIAGVVAGLAATLIALGYFLYAVSRPIECGSQHNVAFTLAALFAGPSACLAAAAIPHRTCRLLSVPLFGAAGAMIGVLLTRLIFSIQC